MGDITVIKPQFLSNEAPHGLELLKEYVVLPRLKVIQAMADAAAKKEFGEGALVAVPAGVLVAGPEQKFVFTPLFFWPEWMLINPMKLKATHPMVAERTVDPASPMVTLSRDQNTRMRFHPEHPNDRDYMQRYVEALHYVVMIRGFADMPMVLTFSKGEHGTGTRFANLISMRSAPIFACVFEAMVTTRQNRAGQSWFGVEITNPCGVEPWVTEDEYAANKKLFMELDSLHKSSRLKPAADEEADTNAAEDEPTASM